MTSNLNFYTQEHTQYYLINKNEKTVYSNRPSGLYVLCCCFVVKHLNCLVLKIYFYWRFLIEILFRFIYKRFERNDNDSQSSQSTVAKQQTQKKERSITIPISIPLTSFGRHFEYRESRYTILMWARETRDPRKRSLLLLLLQ